MPRDALARKVRELNVANENSLPTEWEIMLTSAASRQCSLEYEPNLGGRRKADMLIMPNGVGTPGCLVEITTISDESAHKENPYSTTCAAIRKKLRKLGAPTSGWGIQVDGRKDGPYRDAKVRLMLGQGRTEDLFDAAFYDFVKRVKKSPAQRHVHEWRGEQLAMTLTFDPTSKYHFSPYLDYTAIHSLKRNPLASALTAKCKQLRQTGHSGPYGVIVCDGGCNVLSRPFMRTTAAFAVRDIIWEHFRSSTCLSFVLVLYVETGMGSILGDQRTQYIVQALPCFRIGMPSLADVVLRHLTKAAESLPRPTASPANAVRCYIRQYPNEWWQFPGRSISMSNNRIKLSSRALLELLAGRKTPADFFAAFGDDDISSRNHFDRQRAEGRCITEIKLTRGAGDDDEIEFVFGPPDAAATAYRLPE